MGDAEFDFSDERSALRESVRRFCNTRSTRADVRRWMESSVGHDPDIWEMLGRDLGVLGLAAPTEYGGGGGSVVDQAIAVEEFGAALLCGPILGTVALAIPALTRVSDVSIKRCLLPALVEGRAIAAFAGPSIDGSFDGGPAQVTAVRESAGWVLSGSVRQVPDAAAADFVLVTADTNSGVSMFLVQRSNPGVSVDALSTMDLTRRQASVGFAGCSAQLVANPHDTARICAEAFNTALVLLAAEQLGGAQRMLETTVEYAKQRIQFGRAIGSFQAVKHRCADMLIAIEQARSLVYHAAWAVQDGKDDSPLAASAAKAWASDTYYRVAADAIQTFGGIGFTWEHHAHLYFKRAVTNAVLLGTAAEHRARVADLVLGASAL